MRFGLGPFDLNSGPGRPRDHLQDLVRVARAAEALGFDSVWIGGGGARGGAPPVVAAALGRATRWIRIGVLLPVGVTHPLHLAEDLAVVDQLTGGRAMAGLVPPPSGEPALTAERFARCVDESVAIIRQAGAPGDFTWTGEEFRVPARLPANDRRTTDRISVTPKPCQPVIPLWIDRRLPHAAEVAARHRLPLLASLTGDDTPLPRGTEAVVRVVSPDDGAASVEALRGLREGTGVTLLICHLGPVGAEAAVAVAERIGREIVPHFRTARLGHTPAQWSSLVARVREVERSGDGVPAWTSA